MGLSVGEMQNNPEAAQAVEGVKFEQERIVMPR
jgi:hypothetical protein